MKKRDFNKNKLKIKLLALFVSLLFVVGAGKFIGDSLAAENNIEVDKKITSFDETKGICNIELSVKGELMESEKKADIVLCIDSSGSMNNIFESQSKLMKVKSAVEDFSKMFSNGTDKLSDGIRIGVCQFYNGDNFLIPKGTLRDDYVKVSDKYYQAGDLLRGSSADGKKVCDFTDKPSDIKNALSRLNNELMTSTNMQAGIECAGEMLKNSTNKKYIILFTDGYPTISNNHAFAKSTGNVYVRDGKGNYTLKAENVEDLGYKTALGNWKRLSKVTLDSKTWLNDRHFIETQKAYNSLLVGSKDEPAKYKNDELKFYVIADTSGLDRGYKNLKAGYDSRAYDINSEYGKAINLLQSINNTGGMKELTDINQISNAFKEIAANIDKDASKAMLRDGRIEDFIPNEFIMPTEAEIKAELDSELKSGVIKDIKIDNDSRKITFILGTVRQTEVKFRYSLKVKNQYFYGPNVSTNTKAELYYKEPAIDSTIEKKKDFPVPKVTINPKLCSLDIEKRIFNPSGNTQIKPDYNDDNLECSKFAGELYETFSILLKGTKGNYNFKVDAESPGSTENMKSMDFIMKDDETDLDAINNFINNSNNYLGFSEDAKIKWKEWKSLGYVTAGSYAVSEVVPMNYSLNRIRVISTRVDNSVIEDVYDGDKLQNAKIDVNSSIKHIKIIVENRKVNSNYWFDKSVKDNEFKFSITGK